MSTIYRWHVSAKYLGDDPRNARLELIRRAGQTPHIESGPAQWGYNIPGESSDFEWQFATKAEAYSFAATLNGIPGVIARAEPINGRLLHESEGRTTKAELLAGKQACYNCGAVVAPSDPQVVAVVWMMGPGFEFPFTCRECATVNEIRILAA